MTTASPEIPNETSSAEMESVQPIVFADIQDARAQAEAAHAAWWAAYQQERRHTTYGNCSQPWMIDETIRLEKESRSIRMAAVAQFGDPEKARYGANGEICRSCLEATVFPGGPRHEPSARCRSGARAHCSCGTCF